MSANAERPGLRPRARAGRAAAFAAAALAAAGAGCISEQARRYFEIRMTAVPPAGGLPRTARSIGIESPFVEPVYDDYRIVYRVSPYELNYYSYEFWAVNPGVLVADATESFLRASGAFTAVVRNPAREATDLLLRSHLRAIEEVDAPSGWSGRLAMDLEFVDPADGGKVVAGRSFDRREPLPEKRVAALPGVLSRILQEELAAAVRELAARLGRPAGAESRRSTIPGARRHPWWTTVLDR